MTEAIIYLLIITAVEVVTIFFNPLWGLIGHAAMLAAVIMHSARLEDKPRQQLVLSLAIVPLIRVMNLSMPLIPVSAMWRFAIVYAPLLVASIVLVRTLGYHRGEVGLTFRFAPFQLVVALTGLFLGWLEYVILKPEVALISQFTWSQVLMVGLILLASTGFVEEFAFRGVLQHGADELFGGWGIIYVSVIFAILHMGFRSWLDVLFVFGVALFFGWVVKKTGSLLGVTLSHGIANIVLYLVIPLFF